MKSDASHPLPLHLGPLSNVATPVLVIEADQPDRSVFDRGDYYRTALTLMGEPTYQQRLHMDIHGHAEPKIRRPLKGRAAESNDLPELKLATKEAIPRHGVQVVMIDEAHHMLYGGDGASGSTLQGQLEWLKSLSSTAQIIHVLVGTYDLLNFGKLNGQIGRRCLPVHFSRYRLEREADCLEFQSALVSLLEQVPLRCDQESRERRSPITEAQQAPAPEEEEPQVKKTRSRKKSETKTPITPAEQGSVQEASLDGSPVPTPPKRGRRKKSAEEPALGSASLPKAGSSGWGVVNALPRHRQPSANRIVSICYDDCDCATSRCLRSHYKERYK